MASRVKQAEGSGNNNPAFVEIDMEADVQVGLCFSPLFRDTFVKDLYQKMVTHKTAFFFLTGTRGCPERN